MAKENFDHQIHEMEFKSSELMPSARRKKLLDIEIPVQKVLTALEEIVTNSKAPTNDRVDAARGLLGFEELLNDIETKGALAEKVAEFAKSHEHSTDKISKQLDKLKPKKQPWEEDEDED